MIHLAPVEAEYSDGYIHSERDLQDVSPYDPNRNVLNDIVEKRPEADHGKMVRFSVFVVINGQEQRVDVDWTDVPRSAKPVRFAHYEQDQNTRTGDLSAPRLVGVDFGYQYKDALHRTVNKIQEIR